MIESDNLYKKRKLDTENIENNEIVFEKNKYNQTKIRIQTIASKLFEFKGDPASREKSILTPLSPNIQNISKQRLATKSLVFDDRKPIEDVKTTSQFFQNSQVIDSDVYTYNFTDSDSGSIETLQASTPNSEYVENVSDPPTDDHDDHLIPAENEAITQEISGNEEEPLAKDNRFLSAHQFRNLNAVLQKTISIEQIDLIHSYLLNKGNALLEKAYKDQTLVEQSFENLKIYATQSGKIFFELQPIGEGAYKAASKIIKIVTKKMLETLVNPKVIALEKSNVKESVQDYELMINKVLYQQNKTRPFQNVCVSKPVRVLSSSTKTVVNGFISPFAAGGNVDRLLNAQSLLSAEQKVKIALNMATAVSELHALNIVHRDIKPDNFLIFLEDDGEFKVKIADYGTASYVDERRMKTNVKFPQAWIPPEWLKNGNLRFNKDGDIFQLGITIYQIFSQTPMSKLPFYHTIVDELVNKALSQQYDESILKGYNANQLEQIDRILVLANPKNRSTISNLIKLMPEIWPGMQTMDSKVRNFIMRMIDEDFNKRPSVAQVVEFFQKLDLRI